MANCLQCSKEVGCACNLISNVCLTCYSSNLETGTTFIKPTTTRVVYENTVPEEPGNEFTQILSTPGITKEEKIRRINNILEKAREQIP
jgi:hypothetical protein